MSLRPFLWHPFSRLTAALYILATAVGRSLEGMAALIMVQFLIAAACLFALCRPWSPNWRELFAKPQSMWGLGSLGAYLLATLGILFLLPGALSSLEAAFEGGLSLGHFATLVMAPLFEEIYFRGIAMGLLVKGLESRLKDGALWAVYLQALLFFIFHIPLDPDMWSEALAKGGVPVNLGPFALGLWCGLIVLKDRSLGAAILIHALANVFARPWSLAVAELF